MKKIMIYIISAAALLVIADGFASPCSDVLFSTKTPYEMIAELNTTVHYPDQCEPIQINMVHRHGNRYPSTEDVENMDTVIDKVNKELSNTVKDSHSKLLKVFSARTDKLLSHVGEKELYDLAKRIRVRFPKLFSYSYSPLSYSFNSSCKLRCTHSSNALAAALFENSGVLGSCRFQPIAINSLGCEDDQVLRFFDICNKYKIKVKDNKTAFKESDLFANGKEMNAVLKKVKSRIGLQNLTLNSTDIETLFLLCSYEIGMFKGSLDSGLCSLFDKEDRRVVEYLYDMNNYLAKSGAFEISYAISCTLIKDIYHTLLEAKESPKYAKHGVFRSAHAETILPLFTLLGLFDLGEHLRHDNFAKMRNRSFQGGCYSPFSGNLYFVLYKCKDGDHKIQLYVNERLTKIPCCADKYLCSFDKFLKYYKKIVDSCNLDEMCKV